MENKANGQQPGLIHVEPVLAVQDVSETVVYWHEVLGFPGKWTWGDPPNHGGVSWHGTAFVQFSQNPELAAVAKGNSVWIRARNLDALYALHQKKGALVVVPPENKPWGFTEYTVREKNGYHLHFSAPISDTKRSAETPPETVRIIARTPLVSEHQRLVSSVGWAQSADKVSIESLLASIAFAVVAEDIRTGAVVGCALLLGDDVSFYYVKDVMVHPDWQGKRVGTALMQALTHWLDEHAPDNATVGLFTGEHLAAFYRKFGFIQACGMCRQISR